MPATKKRPAASNAEHSPRTGRRIADAGLGAISGAIAGAAGVVFMAPFAPPVLLTVGGLAALGAAGGYRWGRRVHAAIWEAFLNTNPSG
jgi:hypothetical protein